MKKHERNDLGYIRVGPAGWAYKEWEGIVYPAIKPKGFHPAAYLAQYYDTIEINSTFYRPPRPEVRKRGQNEFERIRISGTQLTSGTALHTNATPRPTMSGSSAMALHLWPKLAGSEHCCSSFRGHSATRMRIGPTCCSYSRSSGSFLSCSRFATHPEMRPPYSNCWESSGSGCATSTSRCSRISIKPAAQSTSPIGYVRLHGRNYQQWFTENKQVGDRYNYLYSPAQLEPGVDRIKEVAKKTRERYAVTNDHLNGQAAVNALGIAAFLSGEPVDVPEPLAERYPRLKEIAGTEQS